ncbi:MAG: folate family ECF transporter S component [Angelakisella sp.]|nr:folate family ECF transporter S component [Angelakisella sp.]
MYKNPESLSLASPFSRSYWRTALRELQNLRMLTLAAIVVALRIVLSGLYIPLGDNLNIFFGYFVNSLGAAIYGPVVALLSGFATDVLGYFVHPTGPFFPGYVLSTMLGSFFYALFFYRARVTALRVVLAKLSVNLLVNVGLGALWSAIQFSKGYYYYLVKSLAKNIGLLPVEALLLWLFLRAMAPICTKNGLLPKQEKKN